MYLIDSSVWIEYLRPSGSPKIKARVRKILESEEAVTCGIVVVEILRGARTEKDYRILRDSLLSLPGIPITREVIDRASRWGFLLDRKGKQVPTTDLIITSCAHKTARLVHADRDFEIIASICDLDRENLQHA
ncbi:MAG: Ribonuclease VapC11 [Syntrophaceae bacterium PtaU1.Bin231]|nr:MAG: Ribonuclease VapC11 [Syntrophaceae bacterium PtaU1.Bin231]